MGENEQENLQKQLMVVDEPAAANWKNETNVVPDV